jgi:type III restriction enzyme
VLANDPELLPPANVVSADLMEDLGKAKIIITNFHAFKPREKQAGRLTKKSDEGEESPFANS